MKSLYILLVFTLAASFSNAQNFVYSTVQHVATENTSGDYDAYEISFTTAQAQGITYEWTLVSNSLPVGWTYSLCDYTGCYSGVPASGTMTAISPGENQNGVEGFFLLNLSPLNITGDGIVELYVYDSANPSIGDTVSFHIWHTSTTSGIEDLSSSEKLVYPNPATDVVNIATGSTKGFISNALGQKVLTITPQSNHAINVSNWRTGVYFYSTEINGQSITKRFVVK